MTPDHSERRHWQRKYRAIPMAIRNDIVSRKVFLSQGELKPRNLVNFAHFHDLKQFDVLFRQQFERTYFV